MFNDWLEYNVWIICVIKIAKLGVQYKKNTIYTNYVKMYTNLRHFLFNSAKKIERYKQRHTLLYYFTRFAYIKHHFQVIC